MKHILGIFTIFILILSAGIVIADDTEDFKLHYTDKDEYVVGDTKDYWVAGGQGPFEFWISGDEESCTLTQISNTKVQLNMIAEGDCKVRVMDKSTGKTHKSDEIEIEGIVVVKMGKSNPLEIGETATIKADEGYDPYTWIITGNACVEESRNGDGGKLKILAVEEGTCSLTAHDKYGNMANGTIIVHVVVDEDDYNENEWNYTNTTMNLTNATNMSNMNTTNMTMNTTNVTINQTNITTNITVNTTNMTNKTNTTTNVTINDTMPTGINPHAIMNYTPEYVVAGEEVFFESKSYDEDGYIILTAWQIDLSSWMQENFTYTFNTAGNYTVAMLVLDNQGLPDVEVQTIEVH